ncbi:MAG TPA: H-type small acid-soluble spore protein [Bacillota bacterium]|nr:H-type small acid-soluble spore protein [Bacillota bacterium]
MEKHRAVEIANSPVMKDVTYQGAQVYIQHVDEQTGMAHIQILDEPEQTLTVDVSHLQEDEQ